MLLKLGLVHFGKLFSFMQTHRSVRVAASLVAAGLFLVTFGLAAAELPKAHVAQSVSDARTGNETCAVTRPSDGSTVTLAGIYRSGVISSVAVAGPDYTTHFARLRISEGPTPVTAVVTSHQPMVWSVEGAVDRVERLIVHNALREGAPGRSAGAVQGLPAERVTFIGPKCMNNFSSVRDLHAARARGTVAQLLGVAVDTVVATHTGRAIDLPEGAFFRTEPLIPSTLDATLWRAFGAMRPAAL